MASSRKPARTESWSGIKSILKDWPRPGVVELIHELYDLSDDNRRFLHARLLVTGNAAPPIAETVKVLQRMLKPSEFWNGHFRHIELKRVVDKFEKAIGDPAAVAEVLLTDLAAALQTFSEIGDDETIVDHIYATMKRLHDNLQILDLPTAAPLIYTMGRLAEQWADRFGWGVSDEFLGMAFDWREKLIGSDPAQ